MGDIQYFYTLSQVTFLFNLIFYLIYEKYFIHLQNYISNISRDQFLWALSYVAEYELNASVKISK